MEIIFPDVPEYQFILKGLCSEKFPSYPKFQCEALSQFEEELDADIIFVAAPVAMLNSRNYSFLRAGNIFSYFSGPIIFSPEKENREIYVRERDFVSKYYAKILLTEVNIIIGDGFPAVMEPRNALLFPESEYRKYDLYDRWAKVTGNLPFPLYSGLIKNSIADFKGIVEGAIGASIKYALDNSSTLIRDIATSFSIQNIEMLKRAIFHFINKNTLAISDEEIESLKALNEEMRNQGYPVSKLNF
jgi:predicted solute-binding protein